MNQRCAVDVSTPRGAVCGNFFILLFQLKLPIMGKKQLTVLKFVNRVRRLSSVFDSLRLYSNKNIVEILSFLNIRT